MGTTAHPPVALVALLEVCNPETGVAICGIEGFVVGESEGDEGGGGALALAPDSEKTISCSA
jgi:hypothetical protein